jgi:23S rRNA (cytosine1962-C5)-methyltransferase
VSRESRATADRLRCALERRERLRRRDDLTAYRLVNGGGDGLPGLVVDRFADVLVVHVEREALVPPPLPGFRSAYVKLRPTSGKPVALPEPAWGEPVDRLVVLEHGLQYLVRPGVGLSTGLFLDMREVRAWVLQHADGRQVLNLFAYTCAFGVAASSGGARRVLNLDLSRSYLAWGQENYRLNDLPVEQADFVYGDALDWLARFAKRGQRFDLVIVDPPSFSTSRRGTFSAERDYARLTTAAARVVAPGGILLAATNHAGISGTRFDAVLARGVSEADRQAQLLRRWHEPALDFPVAPGDHPYLKVRALIFD